MQKVKSNIIIVLALMGLFVGFNTASARISQAPDVTCDSATIYGTVWPNGRSVEAWFEWGNSRSTVQNGGGTRVGNQYIPGNVTEKTISYELRNLNENTTYYYRLVIRIDGENWPATTESFTTPSCTLKPTLTFWVDSENVNYNSSTTLRWETDNAPTSCTATGAWTGSKNINGGSQSTGNLTSTKIYYLECFNSAGSSGKKSVTVGVESQIPYPTVNLTADETNLDYGASTIIRWDPENATSCSATGAWSGSKSISGGQQSTGALYSDKTYNITCYGASGTTPATDSVTVYVGDQNDEDVTVDLTADDTNLNDGDSTYLRWTSDNADSCNASGGGNGWSGSKNTSGSFYTGALFNTETYTIKCNNSEGAQVSDSVTVYVEEDNYEEPTVSTRSATDVDEESAVLNGYVDANGGSNVRAWFEWDTDRYDYDEQTDYVNYGSTNGTDFDYYLDGLDSDETYYFRAVAQNSSGEKVYGGQKSFTTDDDNNNNDNEKPDVTTYRATEIETDSATLNGYVDTNGDSTRRWFEWDTRSNSLRYETDKSIRSSSSRNFEETIQDLDPNTTYYFRAAAENSNGTDYGNTLSFRTGNNYENDLCDYGTCAPTAVTNIATNISQGAARLNGLALVENSAYTTGYFEYGKTQGLGNVTFSKSIGNYQSNVFYDGIYNLSPNTIYYYRAVVTNQYGTSYGDIMNFRTGSAITYTNTNTNTNTVYRNTTVVSNTSNLVGNSKPSLVFLSVNENRDSGIIRIGDVAEYIVNYKNVSSKNLKDVVLQIYIPKELEFIEASRGYFSPENSTVVVNIGGLDAQEEGSVSVATKVTTDAVVDKIVVVTANLAYTIIDGNAQEEVFAYTKDTVGDERIIQQGALAFLFGNSFLPNTLLGWLLLILVIALLIIAARKAYYRPGAVIVPNGN